MKKLTGQYLIEDMTDAEIARAQRVESVLPALREVAAEVDAAGEFHRPHVKTLSEDRKSTRLNSSHDQISYAVFCL